METEIITKLTIIWTCYLKKKLLDKLFLFLHYHALYAMFETNNLSLNLHVLEEQILYKQVILTSTDQVFENTHIFMN